MKIYEQEVLERHLVACLQSCQTQVPNGIPLDVSRVLDSIHELAFEPGLKVGQILNACGIRSNDFSARFRYYLSTTPHQYIEELRVRAALRCIRATQADMLSVAFAVGYDNYRTFLRAFQRQTGLNPLETKSLEVLPLHLQNDYA